MAVLQVWVNHDYQGRWNHSRMHLFIKFVLKLATGELNKLSTIDEIFHVYLFVVR